MTTFVTITESSGETRVSTLLGLIRKLDVAASCYEVMLDLVRQGRAEARLIGGIDVTVAYVVPLEPAQAVMPLWEAEDGRPVREFDVAAQLMFELPAFIRCPARSAVEAVALTTGVLQGERGAPAGFQVEISQDDLENFITGMEIVGPDTRHNLGIQAITITGVNEKLLIGAPPC